MLKFLIGFFGSIHMLFIVAVAIVFITMFAYNALFLKQGKAYIISIYKALAAIVPCLWNIVKTVFNFSKILTT